MTAGHFEAAGSAELRPEHSAAMTLGMLSSGTMQNPTAGFNAVQSPGGTVYGAFDPSLDRASTGPSTGIGGIAGSEFSNAMLGFDTAQSPLTMFDNMASTNMDLSGNNFDWV